MVQLLRNIFGYLFAIEPTGTVPGFRSTYPIALLLLAWQPAVAQDGGQCRASVAGQTVRWIVPYAVGGGYGMYSRLLAPFLEEVLGVRVMVENIPGAGGMIGTRAIMEARPDGRTIGIVNASTLLAAPLMGMLNAPNPTDDFTILGSVSPTRQVWLTGSRSGLQSIEDLIAASKARKVIFAVRDVASGAFINVTVTSDILGIETHVVSGYEGTAELSLAVLRGDVDLIAANFESVLTWIESGELRPLLQISDRRISRHRALDNVPMLGGHDGLAARRAAELGRPIDTARTDASAVASLIGSGGRLVVAPAGLADGMTQCLRQAVMAALGDARLRDAVGAVNLPLEPSTADQAMEELATVERRLHRFAPIVRQALDTVRN